MNGQGKEADMTTRCIVCLQGDGEAVQLYKGLDGYPSRTLGAIAAGIFQAKLAPEGATTASVAEAMAAQDPQRMEVDWRRAEPRPDQTIFGGRPGLSWCYFIDANAGSVSLIGSSLGERAGSAGSHAAFGLSDPANELAEMRPWFAPEGDASGREASLLATLVEQRGGHASAKGRWAAQELEIIYLASAMGRVDRPGMQRWETESLASAPSQAREAVEGMGAAAKSIREAELALEALGFRLNRVDPACLEILIVQGRREAELDRMAGKPQPGVAVVEAWATELANASYAGPIAEIGQFYAAQRAFAGGENAYVIHDLASLGGAGLSAGQHKTIHYRGGSAFATATPPSVAAGRSGP
jgi:hypothetical protein